MARGKRDGIHHYSYRKVTFDQHRLSFDILDMDSQVEESKSNMMMVGSKFGKLTHSQFLEGLKCESQTKNIERAKSRGTLPGLQHYRGVEGRAKATGWD
jgi:hypothetical protein